MRACWYASGWTTDEVYVRGIFLKHPKRGSGLTCDIRLRGCFVGGLLRGTSVSRDYGLNLDPGEVAYGYCWRF